MQQKRGQLSVELSIFLVVLLIIFLVVFLNAFDQMSMTKTQVTNFVVRDTLADLSQSAQRVYIGGNNSQEIVKIQLPPNTNESIVNTTVIGVITLSTATSQQQFLHDTSVPVAGSLPTKKGIYDINVTSNGSTVIFSYTP